MKNIYKEILKPLITSYTSQNESGGLGFAEQESGTF